MKTWLLRSEINMSTLYIAFMYLGKAHFEQMIPMPTPCKTGALLKALSSCINNTF